MVRGLENIAKTAEKLRKFESEMADLFKQGKINGPLHLSYGNEEPLIKIFREVQENDWVCSTHRNHYHALLKGISEDYLKKAIIEGRSMHIMSNEYKFVTSSIVAGNAPIGLGIAMALKKEGSKNRVWVFCGDMAGETGLFYECTKYAKRQDLPITFIVEDNGVSVKTPTQKVWGESTSVGDVRKYSYKSKYPHQGCGKDVGF